MAAVLYRSFNKKKFSRMIILLLLVLALAFNFTNIISYFFPIPYQEVILFQAEQNNVDPFLLTAIIKTESNFNPHAVSARGACGLMQIMPDTGRWILQQTDEIPAEKGHLFDPEINIKLGTWYVADLAEEFHGNNVLVLAAYNGGRGNVTDWQNQYDLSGSVDEINKIPFPETRLFVKKVLMYQKIYRYLYGS